MNKEVIARIKLAPGRVGFFDPLSRIHLTLGSPEAYVYSGTNCASLRRNVKAGVIRIVSGTLGADVPPLRVVKVGKDYKLVSNAHEENKPVYIENIKDKKAEEKAEAKAKEEAEKKAIQDKAEAEARAIVEKEKAEAEEEAEKAEAEAAEKEATKEAEAEEAADEEKNDDSEEDQAEEEKASAKKTNRSRRRSARKNTGK